MQIHQLECEIIETLDDREVHSGEAYIAIRQVDVVEIVKKSRAAGLTCGVDFGLIAYNDTPAYEVIDKGITVMSVDWQKMGILTADFILSGQTHTGLSANGSKFKRLFIAFFYKLISAQFSIDNVLLTK